MYNFKSQAELIETFGVREAEARANQANARAMLTLYETVSADRPDLRADYMTRIRKQYGSLTDLRAAIQGHGQVAAAWADAAAMANGVQS